MVYIKEALIRSEIGENSIVAANSVVVKGKYPAKVVKTNVSWRYLTIKEKKGNK